MPTVWPFTRFPSRLDRPLFLVVVGALAAIAAIVLNYLATVPKEPVPPHPSAAPVISAPASPALGRLLPSFDVARVNPKGDAVIAGRAAPGSSVEIFSGDQAIGSTVADAQGEWVFVPETPLSPGTHRLHLRSTGNGAEPVAGTDELLILVQGPTARGADPGAGDGERPMVLLLPRSGKGVPFILQKPEGDGGLPLTIEVADHDVLGTLTIAGRGRPLGTVRVYVDDRLLGETTADADGAWRVAANLPLAPGPHPLRVDQLDPQGRTVARASVPFASGIPETAVGDRSFRIAPGDSLWRIAREVYGQGPAYTVIYQANRRQIRDPDRIYPGQVLRLPGEEASEPAADRH